MCKLQNNFINNFTHELNTPFTSLTLFLQTVEKYELSRKEQLKYIRYMLNDVNRVANNIDQILGLAKIESNNYKTEFINQNITTVITRFIIENKHFFESSIISIEAKKINYLNGKINQPLFEMLSMNILTNTMKYNFSKKARVEITFKKVDDRIHINFKDNGVGFDQKEVKKIFDKFYQIVHSKNITAKGSGLGLYLTKNIAHIHGGDIFAKSPGKRCGAVFTLILPILHSN